VKTPTVLFVCYLMLFSTLAMRASAADPLPVVPNPHSGTASGLEGGDCGGEPCDAVVRGFRAVDHYIEFFKRVEANAPPGVVPPVASTDGVHFDRRPSPEERDPLPAYLRKL
jgi:hypothetical protein